MKHGWWICHLTLIGLWEIYLEMVYQQKQSSRGQRHSKTVSLSLYVWKLLSCKLKIFHQFQLWSSAQKVININITYITRKKIIIVSFVFQICSFVFLHSILPPRRVGGLPNLHWKFEVMESGCSKVCQFSPLLQLLFQFYLKKVLYFKSLYYWGSVCSFFPYFQVYSISYGFLYHGTIYVISCDQCIP